VSEFPQGPRLLRRNGRLTPVESATSGEGKGRDWLLFVLGQALFWACAWPVMATGVWLISRDDGWWTAASFAAGPATGFFLGTVLTTRWQDKRAAQRSALP